MNRPSDSSCCRHVYFSWHAHDRATWDATVLRDCRWPRRTGQAPGGGRHYGGSASQGGKRPQSRWHRKTDKKKTDKKISGDASQRRHPPTHPPHPVSKAPHARFVLLRPGLPSTSLGGLSAGISECRSPPNSHLVHGQSPSAPKAGHALPPPSSSPTHPRPVPGVASYSIQTWRSGVGVWWPAQLECVQLWSSHQSACHEGAPIGRGEGVVGAVQGRRAL